MLDCSCCAILYRVVGLREHRFKCSSVTLESCQKKTEIKYVNKIKNHIAGKSVFGGRRNRDGINFQIIFNKGVNGMDVYDYAKRGTDRRLIDSLIEDVSSLMGEKVSEISIVVPSLRCLMVSK